MNILFVSAVLPYPLHSGGQIRIYNLLKRLSKKHNITLVSFIRNEKEREFVKDLGFCDSVHMVMRGRAWQPKYYARTMFGKYPFLLSTYNNREMFGLLEDLLSKKKFDLIQTEPFYVMPSIPALSIPHIVSEHNIEYKVYESFVRRFPIPIMRPWLSSDVKKIRTWEELSWQRSDWVTAVSEEDASTIRETFHGFVTVVPNGVDLKSFPFRAPPKRKNPTIVFVGNFRWYPNRDAAKELIYHIWPGIRTSIPGAHLSIVGRDMPADLKKHVIGIGGEVHDTVDNIAQVYQQSDILVAPHAISGGTKFKMLEAMATGVPIITTSEGMFGLVTKPGKHYFLAQTSEEYVAQVHAIWDNNAGACVVAREARALVEAHYSWDRIASVLESVWEKVYESKKHID